MRIGEVGGVDATGAGADGDDGLALVELAVEQGANLEFADGLRQLRELALGFGHRVSVVLLGTHLDEGLEVVDRGVHVLDAVLLGVRARQGGGDLLGRFDVVPQVGGGRLLLEVGDLLLQLLEVEHLAHGRHRRAQVLDFGRKVDSHAFQGIRYDARLPNQPIVHRSRWASARETTSTVMGSPRAAMADPTTGGRTTARTRTVTCSPTTSTPLTRHDVTCLGKGVEATMRAASAVAASASSVALSTPSV